MTVRLITAWVLAASVAVEAPSQNKSQSIQYLNPAWSPDGETIAFESSKEGKRAVYTIRPDGSGLRRLTPSGSSAEQPSWSPDGRKLVFSSDRDGESKLYIMDLDAAVAESIPNTRSGFFASFSPDGRWIVFGAQDAPRSPVYRVHVIRPDGSRRKQLGDSTKSNEGPRWTTDGRRIAFTQVPVLTRLANETVREFVQRSNKGQVLVTSAPDGSDQRTLPSDSAKLLVSDPEVSPDGKWRVYSKAAEGENGLYLKEISTGDERLLLGPSVAPPLSHWEPVVSPDGRRLAYLQSEGNTSTVWIADIDGANPRQVSSEQGEHLRWAGSDRLQVSGVDADSGRVFLIGIEGAGRRVLASVPGRSPLLSPAGNQVAFLDGPWNSSALLVAHVDGSRRHRVAGGSSTAWNPTWSPDGKWIAYTYGEPARDPSSRAPLQIHVVRPDGSGDRAVTHMTSDEGSAQTPAWSSNGRMLAVQVSGGRGRPAHIWIINLIDGHAQKLNLHTDPSVDEVPSWFPDRRRIAFQSDRSGVMEVWVMHADGAGAEQVTGRKP